MGTTPRLFPIKCPQKNPSEWNSHYLQWNNRVMPAIVRYSASGFQVFGTNR